MTCLSLSPFPALLITELLIEPGCGLGIPDLVLLMLASALFIKSDLGLLSAWFNPGPQGQVQGSAFSFSEALPDHPRKEYLFFHVP